MAQMSNPKFSTQFTNILGTVKMLLNILGADIPIFLVPPKTPVPCRKFVFVPDIDNIHGEQWPKSRIPNFRHHLLIFLAT